MLSNQTFNKSSAKLVLALFLTASLSTVNAEGRKGPPKGKPPAEAFAACANQTEAGSSCSFSNAEGEAVEGKCKVPRRSEEALVCAPSRGKHGGKRQHKRD